MSEAPSTGAPSDLDTAWQLARLELLEPLQREPTEPEIAAHIAGSGALRFIAGLHAAPISAERILALRGIGSARYGIIEPR